MANKTVFARLLRPAKDGEDTLRREGEFGVIAFRIHDQSGIFKEVGPGFSPRIHLGDERGHSILASHGPVPLVTYEREFHLSLEKNWDIFGCFIVKEGPRLTAVPVECNSRRIPKSDSLIPFFRKELLGLTS